MKKLIIAATLLISTSAQAYRADQEALLVISRTLAAASVAEAECNVTTNDQFFQGMFHYLETDKQDMEVIKKLVGARVEENAAEFQKIGKEAWCGKYVPILTRKTMGFSPVEAK
jgi:hypothetical protein